MTNNWLLKTLIKYSGDFVDFDSQLPTHKQKISNIINCISSPVSSKERVFTHTWKLCNVYRAGYYVDRIYRCNVCGYYLGFEIKTNCSDSDKDVMALIISSDNDFSKIENCKSCSRIIMEKALL